MENNRKDLYGSVNTLYFLYLTLCSIWWIQSPCFLMRFTFCLTFTKCLSSLVPYIHLLVFPWPTFSFNLSWCLNVNPLDTFSFVCIISQSWLSRHILHFSRKNLVILQLILNSCGIPESNKSVGVYLHLDIFQRFFSRSQAFIPNLAWKTWIHFTGTKVTSFIKPASLVIPARKLVPTNVIWLTACQPIN